MYFKKDDFISRRLRNWQYESGDMFLICKVDAQTVGEMAGLDGLLSQVAERKNRTQNKVRTYSFARSELRSCFRWYKAVYLPSTQNSPVRKPLKTQEHPLVHKPVVGRKKHISS